jgi:hypothetical protein
LAESRGVDGVFVVDVQQEPLGVRLHHDFTRRRTDHFSQHRARAGARNA